MKQPKDYIIFPLDVPTRDEALKYVMLLKDDVGLFKVGLELFISQGPGILQAIREIAGNKIFLDLKLHDIPATVKRAFRIASSYGPEFITVHCDQGEGSLREIAERNPGNTKILAVTLLTSLDTKDIKTMGYKEAYVSDPSRLVLLRARIAQDAGCQGIVCSGHEVSLVKRECPDLIAVTPGIRPAWSLVDRDDQRRIVTPRKAVQSGADYIVVGRPIRDAQSPKEAARKVAEEIASGL
ncbi:MAG: orotidine-5'-phosphate decarboxylase [Deltaproteobacteria bacterium]|nr:orotidine-5'-phosphate decarboxylase [Deltaproteobacteria bacterium]MBW2015314.1 orotidine-5'-phosphate decarboxylase [Deltaproteobacteria bacterium]MBW2302132.1 orotidine-5'-phosphate decarboxylase [Deltaproteobacteria bacterium]